MNRPAVQPPAGDDSLPADFRPRTLREGLAWRFDGPGAVVLGFFVIYAIGYFAYLLAQFAAVLMRAFP